MLALLVACLAPWAPQEGRERIGRAAPSLAGVRWTGPPPALAGKVVLVRFWTVDCALCAATLPALARLAREHEGSGLVVAAIHHPKSARGRDPEAVRAAARELAPGVHVGLDDDWLEVRAWGAGTDFRRYTSLTFLVDREGVVRWLHDGGELHPGGGAGHEECARAFASLEAALGRALAPSPAEPGRAGEAR